MTAPATQTEFVSRLECTAHDIDGWIKQLGYLRAEWPVEKHSEPAFMSLDYAIGDLSTLAQRLRTMAEEV